MIGYCKDCENYKPTGCHSSYEFEFKCISPKISEGNTGSDGNNSLRYSYCEGGIFSPEPLFGCIHFKINEKSS